MSFLHLNWWEWHICLKITRFLNYHDSYYQVLNSENVKSLVFWLCHVSTQLEPNYNSKSPLSCLFLAKVSHPRDSSMRFGGRRKTTAIL